MPRQRLAARKIASLDVAPIDQDEQEELIELLRIENLASNRLFINIFTVVFLLPIPLYVHVKYCRRSPVDAFLSIATQICVIVGMRYLPFMNFEGLPLSRYYSYFAKPHIFTLFTNLLASYVAYRRYEYIPNTVNWLFYAPLVSSVASTLVVHWVLGLSDSIDGLEKLKYKYKSA